MKTTKNNIFYGYLKYIRRDQTTYSYEVFEPTFLHL